MSLPDSPNKTIPNSLRRGDDGWPVYALQSGLDIVGYPLETDGVFGPATDRQVRGFQTNQRLIVDGIAGNAVQSRIATLVDKRTHDRHPLLPAGLLRGFAESEGGNNLGAVNWSVSGGVDCGIVQIRCYGPPFDRADMLNAYDPGSSMERVAVTFQGLVTAFRTYPYAKTKPTEFAQRCAALAWNWPWAAEQYAKRGSLGTSADKDATWAVVGGNRIKFPDGQPVKTWKDWSEFYALGGKHGEGRVTRFVNW